MSIRKSKNLEPKAADLIRDLYKTTNTIKEDSELKILSSTW